MNDKPPIEERTITRGEADYIIKQMKLINERLNVLEEGKGKRIEELEKRVADSEEHIHDLEKIIRDGEVFDAINEVIRKLHNRVCDLEGYGKKEAPAVETRTFRQRLEDAKYIYEKNIKEGRGVTEDMGHQIAWLECQIEKEVKPEAPAVKPCPICFGTPCYCKFNGQTAMGGVKKDAPAVVYHDKHKTVLTSKAFDELVKPEAKPECNKDDRFIDAYNKMKPSATEGQGLEDKVRDFIEEYEGNRKRISDFGQLKESLYNAVRSHSLPKDKILIDRKVASYWYYVVVKNPNVKICSDEREMVDEVGKALGAERGEQ